MGVLIVDAVHHRGLEHNVGADLNGAQGRGRVGGEEGVAGAAAEDGDLARVHRTERILAGEGRGYLRHGDGGEHLRRHAQLLQLVGDGQCVHHRCQHTDLIGQRALHLAAGTAAPEVAAAHDDADLDAQLMGLLHAAADRIHGRLVEAGALLTTECLAADLQKDTLIFQCHNNIHHLYQIWPRCAPPFLSLVYFTIKLLQSKQANASSSAKVSPPALFAQKKTGHLPRNML